MSADSKATFLKALAVLLVVRLALMVVVPVFDPSEARYAAISANMARTDDFVVPCFTYEDRYQSFDGKPPLVFQAGGLAIRALGSEHPWALNFAVRLFPLLSAILLLAILYRVVKRFSDAETGRLAVLVCATATAFYTAAGMSMTDISLTCCVAGALLLYRAFADGFALRHAAGVAALLGAGMLVKGPVALVLFGLPVFLDALLNRRWKALFHWKWLLVAPIFLVIAVPWFVLVERRNPGAVEYFFVNENFLRFVKHDYGDKYGKGREAFRGVSVLWALVVCLPWVLVPAWTAAKGLWTDRAGLWKRVRAVATDDFFALAALAIVGFWCLTSRVLLYYLFPMVPLFAAALALRGDRRLLWRLAPWCTGATAVVLTVGLFVAMAVSENMEGPKGAYRPDDNQYSYEFYHGTPPSARK